MKEVKEQLDIINRGAVEIITPEDLQAKLLLGRPLRVKWGADPSAPDIHLGHAVVLNKLRQFQELGHKVVFVIGDFTALIGDPSGKSETRKMLSREVIEQNAKTYQEQVFKILDRNMTEVVYNSEWLEKMGLADVFQLSSQYTVARMLERKDFKERFKSQSDISVLEFLYPLLQGYDSVHLQADIEVGGTDQKFNLLMGRTLQQRYGQKPQAVVTLPLLEGTDGAQKMSKSLGNYIGVTEPLNEIYGKIMSISDKLMLRYFELLTNYSLNEIKKMHPKEAKMQLARHLVAQFYDEAKAAEAEKGFDAVFKNKGLPEKIMLFPVKAPRMGIVDLLVETKLAASKMEAKRLIGQNGVRIDDAIVSSDKEIIDLGIEKIVKVGKRKFLRVIGR
ncbi:MAG: tyrosine--tRNA ligase [Candidatus Margulisbacteria bacterium]|nr:tyrosine--tRNA ligase [Candidatus Margulisiibacteriota bacterium]